MYKNGYEAWNDMVNTYGKVEAAGMAARYLAMQEKAKYNNDESEIHFCRELQTAKKIAFIPLI